MGSSTTRTLHNDDHKNQSIRCWLWEARQALYTQAHIGTSNKFVRSICLFSRFSIVRFIVLFHRRHRCCLLVSKLCESPFWFWFDLKLKNLAVLYCYFSISIIYVGIQSTTHCLCLTGSTPHTVLPCSLPYRINVT